MNDLPLPGQNLVLALHGVLAPAWQKEAFDTVCKIIPESLTLKFKYQNAASVEKPETH